MYLKSLSLTNFRQFGIGDNDEPGLTLLFNPNFNVIVGENDAGKTAIVDGIRYLLGSVSDDYEKISEDDFHYIAENVSSDSFYIEGTFTSLNEREAGAFLEWLSFDETNNYELRVSLKVEKKKNDNGKDYIERKLQAGDKSFETMLDSRARDILKTTYLKPLRDASNELKPGLRSRLATILKAHPAFKVSEVDSSHQLVTAMEEANLKIESFFNENYVPDRSLIKDIDGLLSDFYDQEDQSKSKSRFTVSKTDLASILRKLSLDTIDRNLGLGNQNLLFIAAELLLLNDFIDGEKIVGPQITIIEEIEAHLHTQAQIRLIKYLENKLKQENNMSQFVLTSHSPSLVSSIDPKNIIFLHDKVAYPLREEFTMMSTEDYLFMERFLDSTKSNLFFTKGLIFVEGESEMLLIPALANLIGYPLHKFGITLINVNGTSFERYIKLFSRSDSWQGPLIELPISIITDLDIKPLIYYSVEDKNQVSFSIQNEDQLMQVLEHCDESIEEITCIFFGNEFSTLKKLADSFGFTLDSTNQFEIEIIVKKNINEETIKILSTDKKEKLTEKYCSYNANVDVFVSKEWTLEYCLAKSCLSLQLLKATFEARYNNPYRGKNNEKYEDIKNKLNPVSDQDDEVAYEIFKPLNDKNVSKAEVAQNLAVKLFDFTKNPEEHDEWKNKVLEDENLKYLIDAIRHSSNISNTTEEVVL